MSVEEGLAMVAFWALLFGYVIGLLTGVLSAAAADKKVEK